MIKIYHVSSYVSIDGREWREVGRTGYRITDEEVSTTYYLIDATFEQAYKHLSQHHLDGIYNDSTFFRNKPLINIYYCGAWDSVKYKKFDTISYKIEFKEWTSVSLDWIMRHADADQCIQYLKERGITTCPIMK